MSWRCSATSNVGLIGNMWDAKLIKSSRVKEALLQVDRRNYFGVDAGSIPAAVAYADSPQPIGNDQTISAPHMHAHALEVIVKHAVEGTNVLDLGSGSGYLTAAMAALVGPNGKAFGIERHGALAKMSVENVKRDGKGAWLDSGRLSLAHGDGSVGLKEHAPYSAIHVGPAASRVGAGRVMTGAAAATIPQDLVDQLARPGRLVIPVGPRDGSQVLTVVDKGADGKITTEELFGVMYVPFHLDKSVA